MTILPRWRWIKREAQQSSKRLWTISLIASIGLTVISFALLVVAGYYLDSNYSDLPSLPDLGHQTFPVVDLRFLTRIGLLTSLVLFGIGGLNEPSRVPYFFFMGSFWFLIRIASMTVTPFGIPADSLPEYSQIKDIQSFWDFLHKGLNSQNVLFFSGHTGLPFLGFLLFSRPLYCRYLVWPMALITILYLNQFSEYPVWLMGVLTVGWCTILIFRNHRVNLNTLFLVWSAVMGVSVLLIRSHYSIDVLGAFFMTAGIYFVGKALFKKIERVCEKTDEYFERIE